MDTVTQDDIMKFQFGHPTYVDDQHPTPPQGKRHSIVANTCNDSFRLLFQENNLEDNLSKYKLQLRAF